MDDYLSDMIFSNNMTAKSFSNVRILVRGIWNRAKKKKLIDYRIDDVLEGLEVSKKDFRKPEEKNQVYTDSERKKMVNYLIENPDTCNLGILLIFATGIRVGELAALKPEDVFENKIHVSRTEICYEIKKGKYAYEVRDFPKTQAGIRDVYVPNDFIYYLNLIKTLAKGQEWLFEKDGKRIKTYQYQCRLRYICEKKLHIPVKSPHKIRKTYVSCLIDANLPDTLITGQIGHTNIQTTKKHYYKNHYDNNKVQDIFSGLRVFPGATQIYSNLLNGEVQKSP